MKGDIISDSIIRLIARLDVKGSKLIKGIHLEGMRVVGDPNEHALRYYKSGIDEIIFMDMVASLYGRNSLRDIVQCTARDVFVPLTVGGGIRSVDDVRDILRSGADKVAVNTAVAKRPELITEISRKFGSQCMILSIEAKRKSDSRSWEVFVDNGREHTGMDVVEWAKRGVRLGAGEILLTSVDQEGTEKGFDLDLVKAISTVVPVPVIAAGGMGEEKHLLEVVQIGRADAVAMASVLHYDRISLNKVREYARENRISVRTVNH